MVFRSAVGSKLDGLLGGRLIDFVHLTELLLKQALIVTEIASCPLVTRVCKCRERVFFEATFLRLDSSSYTEIKQYNFELICQRLRHLILTC